MVHKEFMSKSELKAYGKLEEQCLRLNAEFTVGEVVSVKKDDGSYETDTIYNEFTIVSGGVVAWLENNRCYLAERVIKCLF